MKLIYRTYAPHYEDEAMPCGHRWSDLIGNLRELMQFVMWDDDIKLQVRPYETDTDEWHEVRWSKHTAKFLMPLKFEPTHKALLRKNIRDLNAAVRLNVVTRHISSNLIPIGLDVEYVDDEGEVRRMDEEFDQFNQMDVNKELMRNSDFGAPDNQRGSMNQYA